MCHSLNDYNVVENAAAATFPSLLLGNKLFFSFFFLSRFFFTDTDNSQDSRGKEGTFFIPLYHFHPLTNIQTFMCNFAREMTITYF